MNSQKKQQKEVLSYHILVTASTMIGVCLTVITIFKVTNFHLKTYADELLGVDTLLFILSSFLSYISIRQGYNKKLEFVADNLFIAAMSIMVVAGILILNLG
jgi:hypothetical protein